MTSGGSGRASSGASANIAAITRRALSLPSPSRGHATVESTATARTREEVAATAVGVEEVGWGGVAAGGGGGRGLASSSMVLADAVLMGIAQGEKSTVCMLENNLELDVACKKRQLVSKRQEVRDLRIYSMCATTHCTTLQHTAMYRNTATLVVKHQVSRESCLHT